MTHAPERMEHVHWDVHLSILATDVVNVSTNYESHSISNWGTLLQTAIDHFLFYKIIL